MKAIFQIPRNSPARLDGPFPKSLKEFVATCLNDDPVVRPGAEDLVKDRIFKSLRKGSSELVDLINRYQEWRSRHDSDSEGEGLYVDFGVSCPEPGCTDFVGMHSHSSKNWMRTKTISGYLTRCAKACSSQQQVLPANRIRPYPTQIQVANRIPRCLYPTQTRVQWIVTVNCRHRV